MFDQYALHHVGIVFPDMAEAERHLADFGLVEDYRGFVELWSCWCIFTKPGEPGGTALELVVPEGGPLARFGRGLAGVHHFAYLVDSIEEVTAWAHSQGMTMLEAQPIKGAGPFLCNFLSPMSTRGVQIEFVQMIE